VLRDFPQSLHPIAEILPRFDPDRVCLNPSQFVTQYHRRYRELVELLPTPFNKPHKHTQRSSELKKSCRAAKMLTFLSSRQKVSEKKNSNINFHENPSSTSRVIIGGQTDRHDETDIRFWQFFERAYKVFIFVPTRFGQSWSSSGETLFCITICQTHHANDRYKHSLCSYCYVSIHFIILDVSISVVCHFTFFLLCSFCLSCRQFNNIEMNCLMAQSRQTHSILSNGAFV
jgi:hypothetical protein